MKEENNNWKEKYYCFFLPTPLVRKVLLLVRESWVKIRSNMNTQPAAASEDLHDDHDKSDDDDDLPYLLAMDDILLRFGAVAVQHPSAIGHEEVDFTGYVV